MRALAAIEKTRKYLHILDGVLSAVIVLFVTFMTQNLDGNKTFLGILFLLLAVLRYSALSGGRGAGFSCQYL